MSAQEIKKKEAELAQKEAELRKFQGEFEAWKETTENALKAREEEIKRQEGASSLLGVQHERLHESTKTVVRGIIGNVTEFSLDENWELWYERLQMYFLANEIKDFKMAPVFLTLLAKKGYALLQNLLSPRKPYDVTLRDMVSVLKSHLQPAPSIIAERYKFKECKQSEGQDVKTFLANLKQAPRYCDFGTNLDSALRDRFVWGLISETCKRKLLSENNLEYARAVEIALSLEAAEQNAAEMKRNVDYREGVHFVKNHRVKQPFSSGNRPHRHQQPKERQGQRGSDVRQSQCYCCGKIGHYKNQCDKRESYCDSCGKQGHLKVMCRVSSGKSESFSKNNRDKAERQHYLTENFETMSEFEELYHLSEHENNNVVKNINEAGMDKPLLIKLNVENTGMCFEIDTGSPISAISCKKYDESSVLSSINLRKTERQFKGYGGHVIKPLGILDVNVKHECVDKSLELFVMPGECVSIVGRPWLRELGLIKVQERDNIVKSLSCIEDVVHLFPDVFTSKLGTYSKGTFSLKLKDNSKPMFCKVRPVPYALRDKIEAELERLCRDGIIEAVNCSDWATPIVPVLKKDGSVRICGDFKVTVNPLLITNRHPIPRINDLVVNLSGASVFSKLDLAHAYQQVKLDEKSRELLTITTHKGLFRYNRLTYGIASAPGLFQGLMEKVLAGIANVSVYFDDVCICGKDKASHDKTLIAVLNRFRECGLTLKAVKCQLSVPRVHFLGYVIDKRGLYPAPEKVDAIVKMKSPENVTELRSFLGLINYYSRFIRNFADIVSPLHRLLHKDVIYKWDVNCENAFCKCKNHLSSNEVLTHYRSDERLKVSCDASPNGVGGVLSHIFANGVERPIAFVSRSLSKQREIILNSIAKHSHYFLGLKAFISTCTVENLSLKRIISVNFYFWQ